MSGDRGGFFLMAWLQEGIAERRFFMAILFRRGFGPVMPGRTQARGATVACTGRGQRCKRPRREHQQHRHETNDRVFLSRHVAEDVSPPANNGTDDSGFLFPSAKGFRFCLTFERWARYKQGMAHTYLIFDFGENEEAAQHARHKLEGWKQAFRLDNKLLFKFERSEPAKDESSSAAKPATPANPKPEKGKTRADAAEKAQEKSKSTEGAAENSGRIRLLVRLDFSDHEKLSQQRWVERIPADDHFKGASPNTVRPGEPNFSEAAKLFDSLD